MSTSVLTLPVPGWYPDPVGAATFRWWDGADWTAGTHDGAQPEAEALELVPDALDVHEPAPALIEPDPEPAAPHLDHIVFENAVFESALTSEPDLSFIEPMPIYAQSLDRPVFEPQPEAVEVIQPVALIEPDPFAPADFPAPAAAGLPVAAPAAPPSLAHAPAPSQATLASTEQAAQPAAALAPAAARPAAPAARRGTSPAKTRWSAILTAYPFVYPFAVGMVLALGYAGGASGSMSTLAIIGGGAAVVLLLPAFILADHDRRELVARGYEPAPSLAWMLLLPPIGYLLARRRVVGPSF